MSALEEAFSTLEALHKQGWFWRLDSVHDGVICTMQNLKRKTYQIGAPTVTEAINACAAKINEAN